MGKNTYAQYHLWEKHILAWKASGLTRKGFCEKNGIQVTTFIDWNRVRIFVRPGNTDIRKQINGLAVLVSEEMGEDPLSGSLFLFSNKQPDVRSKGQGRRSTVRDDSRKPS